MLPPLTLRTLLTTGSRPGSPTPASRCPARLLAALSAAAPAPARPLAWYRTAAFLAASRWPCSRPTAASPLQRELFWMHMSAPAVTWLSALSSPVTRSRSPIRPVSLLSQTAYALACPVATASLPAGGARLYSCCLPGPPHLFHAADAHPWLVDPAEQAAYLFGGISSSSADRRGAGPLRLPMRCACSCSSSACRRPVIGVILVQNTASPSRLCRHAPDLGASLAEDIRSAARSCGSRRRDHAAADPAGALRLAGQHGGQ